MSMPIRPTPTPPGHTSPSIMWTIGDMPPSGVKVSCMQLTEPFDVPVVDAGPQAARRRAEADLLALHVAADELGRRALVDAERGEVRVAVLLGDDGEHAEGEPDADHHGEQDAGLALGPISTPNVTTSANGMIRIAQVSMKLVIGVRFSNGWAELVLKKPPPFVPSCLMAIWLATGPPGIDCV